MRCVYIYNLETEQESRHWWGNYADTERKAREYRTRILLSNRYDFEVVEFAYDRTGQLIANSYY